MKKYLFSILLLSFFFVDAISQNKYIFCNELDNEGNWISFNWTYSGNWNSYPGTLIHANDTVIIKQNLAMSWSECLLDEFVQFEPGSVLIVENNCGFYGDANISKLINYGFLNMGNLNSGDTLINYNEIYTSEINIASGALFMNKSNISANLNNSGTLINEGVFNAGNFSNQYGVVINDSLMTFNGISHSDYSKIINNGTLINNSELQILGIYSDTVNGLFNYGKIISTANISIGTNFFAADGYFENNGEILLSSGELFNSGLFKNYGTITGSITAYTIPYELSNVDNKASIYNNGTMNCNFLVLCEFINDSSGVINGSGYIYFGFGESYSDNTIRDNYGVINAKGWIQLGRNFINHHNGIINAGNDLFNGSVFFENSCENYGIINSNINGEISIPLFENYGKMNNYSYYLPSLLNNHSVINNYGTIELYNQADWIQLVNNYAIINNFGSFSGNGNINNLGGVLINNGIISPGGGYGPSDSTNRQTNNIASDINRNSLLSEYGCLAFDNYTGSVTYVIEIADTTQCIGHDFVSISDTLFANGGLDVSITYQPNPNDIITIIHADTVINVFDTVNIPDGWEVLYNQPNKGDVSVRYGNPCNNLNSDFLQDSVSVCGSSYTLSVPNTFESYLWSNGLQDSIITVNAPGWLFCSVGLGNCTLRDSIFVRLVNAYINQNDTSLCRGTSLTLNTNSSNNILWSNNTTIFSTTVTPSVNTTYFCTATDGVLTCRDSIKININNTLPSTPGVISGTTDICSLLGNNTVSSVVNYTIRKIANANSYLWTLPAGVTLVSGQGDTAVNVTFSNSFVSGVISVKSVNACGVGTGSRTIAVYKRVASTPGVMYQSFSQVAAAITSVCGRSSETYKIRKVAYATSYTWSLTNGSFATISHSNTTGINDTAITVIFQPGFTKDTLIVKSITACSVSASRAIVLNALAVPAAVSSIVSSTGNTIPCIGDVVNYTASSLVPTASQTSVAVYRWSKPNNTTIISANTDSSVITVRFNTGFTGGSITAKGQSACGVYGSSKTMVLQYLPPTPTAIVAGTGNYNACIGDVVSYSVTVPTPSTTQRAAIVYRWTKPFYTTIVSANADSSIINLHFNTGYRGGILSVKGQTACGALGTAKSQVLTNSSCPTTTSPSLYTKSEIKTDYDFDVSVYPNPTSGDFNLRMLDYGNGNYVISIRDLEGRLIKKISTANKIMQCGTDLQPGIYMVEIISGAKRKQIKVVKL